MDHTINGEDLAKHMAFMRTVDPRPIDAKRFAQRFMRYLKTTGFLVENINDGELEHLENKLTTRIADAVWADREDRIMP